jgi:PAS domain S-box-containing protein
MPIRNTSETIEQHKKALVDILDTLPSSIVRVDREGRIDLVNRSFEQFSGIPAAAAYGERIEELAPQFAEQFHAIHQVIDAQMPLKFEKIACAKSDNNYYFSLELYPLDSEKGKMAVIRIDDITEHVRIEELMLHTEKMTMVGGLAAGMAHEINNPLGAIMQNAQNIERRVSKDISANLEAAARIGVSLDQVRAYLELRGINEFIGHIRTAGMRASEIINNMLHFSRHGEPRIEAVDLSEMLDRTLELASSDYDMKKRYNFRNIEIVKDYSPEMPPVSMIVQDMQQVVMNILKNAAQALSNSTRPVPPRVIVRTYQFRKAAVIEIDDNGTGIDEAVRPRIFEPFFSTKEVGVGTGLGLSVAYAIVTKGHGGVLRVRSIPGEGSCFIIQLPLQEKV